MTTQRAEIRGQDLIEALAKIGVAYPQLQNDKTYVIIPLP